MAPARAPGSTLRPAGRARAAGGLPVSATAHASAVGPGPRRSCVTGVAPGRTRGSGQRLPERRANCNPRGAPRCRRASASVSLAAAEVAVEGDGGGGAEAEEAAEETGDLTVPSAVMALMVWCMLSCSLQRVTVPVLAVPVFVDVFGYSPSTMGMLQSSVLVGYLLGQLPSGVLADRFGERVMLIGMVMWSISTAMLPLATQAADPLPWLIAARFLMGLSSAVALPALVAAAAKWVPVAYRTRALTSGYAGFHLGTVAGYVLTPIIAAAAGWQQVFLVYGALGVVTGVQGLRWALRMAKKSPIPSKTAAKDALELWDPASRPPVPVHWARFHLWARLKRRAWTTAQLGVLIVTHSAIGWGFFILQSWTPTFMASLGFQDPRFMGIVSGLPWLVCALITINTGFVADYMLSKGMPRHRVRRTMQVVATLGPALCLIPLFLPGLVLSGPAKIACITGVLVFQAFSYSGFQAYVQDVAPQDAGKIISLTNTFGITAGVLGNMATGLVLEKTNDYRLIFLLTAVFYLLSGIAWVSAMHGKRLRISDVRV